MTNNFRALGYRVGLALAVIAASLVTAAPSSAASVEKRLLVVLCNFENQDKEPKPRSYYEDLFSSQGEGQLNSYDYWHDVSYGQLSLDATVVGWYTIPTSRDGWALLSRFDKWETCVEQAQNDVHYEAFVGAVVVYPEAMARTTSVVGANDTTFTVTGDPGAIFPTTPFLAQILGEGSSEVVRVTAVTDNAFTVERDAGVSHKAGSRVQAVGGDLFGSGPSLVELGDELFTLGRVLGPHDLGLTGWTHETGHLLGIQHSTATSMFPGTEYFDCYDVMSSYSCDYRFTGVGTQFGGSGFYPAFDKGPGLNSVNVDRMGWLAGRKTTFDNSSCRQQTYSMAALNRPDVGGFQQLRFTSGIPTFEYFAVELRDKSGWDRGIPVSAFVLHAAMADGRSMLIDRRPDGSAIGDDLTGIGALTAGEAYVNTTLGMYVGVNTIGAGSGLVTMGSCKLDTELSYVGATRGQHSDYAVLAGRLTVEGSGAPVPGASVNLRLGDDDCRGTSDKDGLAECTVELNQAPGDYPVSATYAGTSAYEAASDADTFTVEKEVTEVVYAGPMTSDYHDRFLVFAQLTDDDEGRPVGRTVTVTLGTGDSCTGTADTNGLVTCFITPTQPAATYTLTTSFAGDSYYEPSSDSDSFVVTHEESTTTVSGPSLILAGTGSTATLQARFVEDGANGDGTDRTAVPSGQSISFRLGSETCSATTDAAGLAQCTVSVPANAALGPQAFTASFPGDAFYEPSSHSKDAIVFAFPSRGAFVLGDNSVASATPTSTMTWWSDAWWTRNSVSGGVAPDSFKGFAGIVTTLPTTNPANSCGGTFRTLPGNSPPTPTVVPSYMGVLVTSSVTKGGAGVNGQWGKIVVVKTDLGFAPKPGRSGTGKIVATFCP